MPVSEGIGANVRGFESHRRSEDALTAPVVLMVQHITLPTWKTGFESPPVYILLADPGGTPILLFFKIVNYLVS